MSGVPRVGRLLDVVGLAVFLTGGGLVARAWLGFQEVQTFQPTPGGPPMEAMALADRFWLVQRVGVGLMVLGVAVFVGAWWVARSRVHGTGDVAPEGRS